MAARSLNRKRCCNGPRNRVPEAPKRSSVGVNVSEGGLEPPRPIRALAPQASASAIPPLGPARQPYLSPSGRLDRRPERSGKLHGASLYTEPAPYAEAESM